MRKIQTLYLLLLMLLVSFRTSAQDDEYSFSKHFYTVVELKRNAETLDINKVPVKTKGYVVQRSSSEMYMFQDDTGVMKLHICPKAMPEFYYNEKIEIEVYGLINYELFRTPVLEAKKISLPKTGFE